jgi:DNA polymerase-3 subunit delta
MQLSIANLDDHLRRGLAPAYLVYGDEPLLVNEACDAIRAAAQAAGFGERERYTVEPGFDWNALYAASQSLSLFAERRLIELRLPTGKPGETGANMMMDMLAQPSPDTVLLVVAGKLEKRDRETKWVTAIAEAGAVVAIYPVEAAQLPAWITRRMRARGLVPGPGVAELLAHHMEGNLLAAAQEIDKLAMARVAGATISADDIEDGLGDNARFTVFGLADSCLQGEAATIERILGNLRSEGVEPVLVLWALARETRELTHMAAELEAGKPLAAVLESRRVWAKRRPLVSRALKRLSLARCHDLIQRAARADRAIKGRLLADPWQELECLALGLANAAPGTCGQAIQ